MLDLRRLRVLREVAARGSFSAAAAELAYTPSAVSQQIAALEREAGAVLVERTARGVRLTDAGQVLVRHAESAMAQLASAEAELEALAGLRGGRLRMASFATAAATVMPPAVSAFRTRHPAVELTMCELDPQDSLPALRRGDLDLALVFDYDGWTPVAPDGGIATEHLLDDPLHLVLPPGHALARRRRLSLAELAREQWVHPSKVCGMVAQRACADAGFEPHVAFRSDEYSTIQGLVAAGIGVALVPELGLRPPRDDVVVRSLGPAAPMRRVSAATLAEGYRSPPVAAMLDVLREAAAAMSARPLAAAS